MMEDLGNVECDKKETKLGYDAGVNWPTAPSSGLSASPPTGAAVTALPTAADPPSCDSPSPGRTTSVPVDYHPAPPTSSPEEVFCQCGRLLPSPGRVEGSPE